MSWFNWFKKSKTPEGTFVNFYILNGDINVEYCYDENNIDEFLFMIATLNLGGLEETLLEILPEDIQSKYKKIISEAEEIEDDSPVIQPYQAFLGKNMQ